MASHSSWPRGARPTLVGQRYLQGVAREQRDAGLMLELLDRGRQCRLGDEQPLFGAPVVQLLARHSKVPQLTQRGIGARGVFIPLWTGLVDVKCRPSGCAETAASVREQRDGVDGNVHESWVVVRPHSRLEALCS